MELPIWLHNLKTKAKNFLRKPSEILIGAGALYWESLTEGMTWAVILTYISSMLFMAWIILT